MEDAKNTSKREICPQYEILASWLLSPKYGSIGLWEQNIRNWVHINKEKKII